MVALVAVIGVVAAIVRADREEPPLNDQELADTAVLDHDDVSGFNPAERGVFPDLFAECFEGKAGEAAEASGSRARAGTQMSDGDIVVTTLAAVYADADLPAAYVADFGDERECILERNADLLGVDEVIDRVVSTLEPRIGHEHAELAFEFQNAGSSGIRSTGRQGAADEVTVEIYVVEVGRALAYLSIEFPFDPGCSGGAGLPNPNILANIMVGRLEDGGATE
ncbi:MAG: hypothetical protein ACRD29_17210 [Acidimicrobiales bacterium]